MTVLNTMALAKRLGIGRDKAYALMKAPGFPSTKLGNMYFVTEENLNKWLNDFAGKEFVL